MTSTLPSLFNPERLAQGIDYPTYHAQVERMVAEGRTSGPDQSEAMVNYTKLTWARMKRALSTSPLNASAVAQLATLSKPQTWLVLTEAWCGDAGQNLPVISLLAQTQPLITLKLLYRDEHPALMDAYLTAGSRSIPKLIAFDQSGRELFTWGPRPARAQALLHAWKANPIVPKEEFYVQLQGWYNADHGQTLQLELAELAVLSPSASA
jgi:hypothetical protein